MRKHARQLTKVFEGSVDMPRTKQKNKYYIEYRVKLDIWKQWEHNHHYYPKIMRINKWRRWKSYANKHSRQQAIDTIKIEIVTSVNIMNLK